MHYRLRSPTTLAHKTAAHRAHTYCSTSLIEPLSKCFICVPYASACSALLCELSLPLCCTCLLSTCSPTCVIQSCSAYVRCLLLCCRSRCENGCCPGTRQARCEVDVAGRFCKQGLRSCAADTHPSKHLQCPISAQLVPN